MIERYNSESIKFYKKYKEDIDIILVGFKPFCTNKNCLDQKNIFMVNRKGELITCYWGKKGSRVIKKY
ncbi:hypothetical protein CVT91_09325 [Candidatus Atribacteria bacterium HGW-Atribacteria-1]|nr:MAG: hypothetical protein CVT91_09325 [Candidatus Atribacteria bacterium HGW-Atribacteria-1]